MKYVFTVLCVLLLAGCGGRESSDGGREAPKSEAFERQYPAGAPTLDAFAVALDVTEKVKSHEMADLRVWVGLEDFMPDTREDMARDVGTIPSDAGRFAQITPHAPGFEVRPTMSQCVRIHATGSAVLFTLAPRHRGESSVSAHVDLFEEPGCLGDPIPKASEFLTVSVTVDRVHLLQTKTIELLSVVWNSFLTFWGALIALLFGALLYIIRQYVKRTTGYDQTP